MSNKYIDHYACKQDAKKNRLCLVYRAKYSFASVCVNRPGLNMLRTGTDVKGLHISSFRWEQLTVAEIKKLSKWCRWDWYGDQYLELSNQVICMVRSDIRAVNWKQDGDKLVESH